MYINKTIAVITIKQSARHYVGTKDLTDDVVAVRIVEDGQHFRLERLNDHGDCITDTAHESWQTALRKAYFEYNLAE